MPKRGPPARERLARVGFSKPCSVKPHSRSRETLYLRSGYKSPFPSRATFRTTGATATEGAAREASPDRPLRSFHQKRRTIVPETLSGAPGMTVWPVKSVPSPAVMK